jgi:hypothetical protein
MRASAAMYEDVTFQQSEHHFMCALLLLKVYVGRQVAGMLGDPANAC